MSTLSDIPNFFIPNDLQYIKKTLEKPDVKNFIEAITPNSFQLISFIENNYIKPKKYYELMNFGWKILNLFVINNFTGPENTFEEIEQIFFADKNRISCVNIIAREQLSIDSEVCYWLKFMNEALLKLTVYNMWLKIHGTSFSCMRDATSECILKLEQEIESSFSDDLEKELNVEKLLVCFNTSMLMYEYDKAEEILLSLQSLLKIAHNLTGCLGKKMKYQERPIAQLIVAIEAADKDFGKISSSSIVSFPENVAIEEESPLLPNTVYQNPNDGVIPELNLYQQIFMLCYCQLTYRTYPKDDILVEQLKPYIDIINSSPKSWIISWEAFLWRCLLEFDTVKRMERSLKQYEVLCESYRKKEPDGNYRITKWLCSNSHTIVYFEETYASSLVKLGCFKSALDIYERLFLWDKMIECYMILGRHEKAEETIIKRLEIEPNSSHLYCLLGQVTKNIEYYEKAWEISNHRSWRSQKMLGLYYLNRDLEKCVDHLEVSLKINYMQEGLWFTLGCIQMRLERFKEAISSFLQCTRLEPDNAECWSNLATVHIQRKNYILAYQIMKEALRFNYTNYKMWENNLYICMQLEYHRDIVFSCLKLIELNVNAIPDDVFAMLTYTFKFETSSIKSGYKGAEENFKRDVFDLFQQYVNKTTPSWNIWKMYASLYDDAIDEGSIFLEMEYLVKAFRILAFEEKLWETDDKARDQTEILAQDLLNCATKISKTETIQLSFKQKHIQSLGLALHNLITRCKHVIMELSESSNMGLKKKLELFATKVQSLIHHIEILSNKI